MELIDIIGILFVAIGIILYLSLGFKLLFSYSRSKKKQSLYLAGLLVFGGLGMFFLMLEQVILLVGADPASSQTVADAVNILQYPNYDVFWVAFIAAAIAWLTSGIAIVSANFFTQSFFPESNKKLLIIPILLIGLYLVLIIFSPFWFEYKLGDWSPEHEPGLNFILWILFFIPLWIVVFLFLYLTINLKRRGSSTWRRLFWIFSSQALLSIGFTIEILNPSTFTNLLALSSSFDAYISAFSRFLLMIYPVLMWIGVFTPERLKSKLGVKA